MNTQWFNIVLNDRIFQDRQMNKGQWKECSRWARQVARHLRSVNKD